MALIIISGALSIILVLILFYTIYKQNELIQNKEVELDIAREEYSLLLESNKEIRDENLKLKLQVDTYRKIITNIDKTAYQNDYGNKRNSEIKLNEIKNIIKNRTIVTD